MEHLLEAHSISKYYGNYIALDNVSLSIPKGAIFGLLGPNGAGKTSLIRIINQITAPDKGSLTFDGSPMKSDHEKLIGYLPEERGLYKKMKVGEQALYLARLKGMSKGDARKALDSWFEKFEITSWWNKRIEELSKGMAQKVQFIITVLHEPKLLILDEPFSGFDPINTNLIKDEIRRLKEQGTTIIFSTHNMESVEEICDHIALINQSKKILDGSVFDVKQANKDNTYELAFSGNPIGFTNALWTGFELIDIASTENGFHKAKVKLLRNNTANDLLKATLPHVEIHSLTEIIPSMNQIFIKKVNEIQQPDTQVSNG